MTKPLNSVTDVGNAVWTPSAVFGMLVHARQRPVFSMIADGIPAAPVAPSPISARQIVVVAAFWFASIFASAASLALDPEIDTASISWAHFFLKHALLALYWFLISLAALRFVRHRVIRSGNLARTLPITALATLVTSAGMVIYFGGVMALVSSAIDTWAQGIAVAARNQALYALATSWQIAIVANAWHYYDQMITQQRERERLQSHINEMQLMVFRAQLEPHFLFNTLNSIASLVRLNRNDCAVIALNQLGALLRGVLEVGQRQRMSWHWEREFTLMYVALQKLRFAEKLDVRLEADAIPDAAGFPIMLLQPLIENAIHHGPINDGETCRIDVRIDATPSAWRVVVRNSVGRTSTHESHGVGLVNVRARLHALYGDAVTIEHGEVDGVYTVNLMLPKDSLEPCVAP